MSYEQMLDFSEKRHAVFLKHLVSIMFKNYSKYIKNKGFNLWSHCGSIRRSSNKKIRVWEGLHKESPEVAIILSHSTFSGEAISASYPVDN